MLLEDKMRVFADEIEAVENSDGARFCRASERVAAAIYRAETPQRELYSSGTVYRSETPNRYFPENSPFAQRSETPAFPVMRETPLPFHPLLYGQNGSSRQDLDQLNNMNYRFESDSLNTSPFSSDIQAFLVCKESAMLNFELIITRRGRLTRIRVGFPAGIAIPSGSVVRLLPEESAAISSTHLKRMGQTIIASFTLHQSTESSIILALFRNFGMQIHKPEVRRLRKLWYDWPGQLLELYEVKKEKKRHTTRYPLFLYSDQMACKTSPSEGAVVQLKRSHDVSDISLVSSESSGCSSERSSILCSPSNAEETPIMHRTESSISPEISKTQSQNNEMNECDISTTSPEISPLPYQLMKKSSGLSREHRKIWRRQASNKNSRREAFIDGLIQRRIK
ncbi:hypothetical protein DICVIV_12062 [Dictyocaulus viviparus]|uniref:Uncharacterized protein n=1 Tax=Dictyocaulus viviparus TaxID=29172 RepID=A0A0D8XBK1_DICVI|nr:hypothetical protein DICVIV_12062 [Dictyocaulus viviparus]